MQEILLESARYMQSVVKHSLEVIIIVPATSSHHLYLPAFLLLFIFRDLF